MTYPKFEEIWQSKFQDAQENPSEAIWEAIEWQIGYKERQRKKWIAWWAAALIAFFLGDGRLVYNFYGKFFEPPQKSLEANINTAQLVTNSVEPSKILKKHKQNNTYSISDLDQTTSHSLSGLISAEASYELAEEKVAAKRPQEEVVQEALGKPKKRAFWLRTQANIQQMQPEFNFKPKPQMASRILDNPSCFLKEQNLRNEIKSFQHLFTWGAGVEAGWQFHKKLYISSGLHYQSSLFAFQSNSQTPELARVWGKKPDKTPSFTLAATIPVTESIVPEELSSANMIPEPIPQSYQFIQKTDYLIMPIKIGYQNNQHHIWQYGIAMGLENSFLLNNSFESEHKHLQQVYRKNNRWQISGIVEVSLGYKISPTASFLFVPFYRHSFQNKNQPEIFQFNRHNFGVGAGLQIGL